MADSEGNILTNLQLKMGRKTYQGNALSMDVIFSYIDNIQQILKPVDEDSFNKAVDDFYKSQQTTA